MGFLPKRCKKLKNTQTKNNKTPTYVNYAVIAVTLLNACSGRSLLEIARAPT